MSSPSKKEKIGSLKARNSAARLLAVQAVFQMMNSAQSAKDIVKEFLEHRVGQDVEGDDMVSPEAPLFSKIVQGVEGHREQLQEMVQDNRGAKALNDAGQPTETLLQAIFLCGVFELMIHQDIDFPIIISDYLHVTHAFYDESEAKLVNALLDSVRKTTR